MDKSKIKNTKYSRDLSTNRQTREREFYDLGSMMILGC